VLSAIGIYSVTPGTDQYVLGSPVFKKITLNLENGKKFIIEAGSNSRANVYIKSATLNGQDYSRHYITHRDLIKGGVLKLEMAAEPALTRGLAETDKPFSLSGTK
jgi:putative alpha-1,2-mannosidase